MTNLHFGMVCHRLYAACDYVHYSYGNYWFIDIGTSMCSITYINSKFL